MNEELSRMISGTSTGLWERGIHHELPTDFFEISLTSGILSSGSSFGDRADNECKSLRRSPSNQYWADAHGKRLQLLSVRRT